MKEQVVFILESWLFPYYEHIKPNHLSTIKLNHKTLFVYEHDEYFLTIFCKSNAYKILITINKLIFT